MQSPWLSKSEWATNNIISGAKLQVYVIWGFTFVWNLISWPILLTDSNLVTHIQEKPETALVLLFPVIGVALIVVSVNSLINIMKFGRTPLVLDPFPGSLGGNVGGKINTKIAYDPSLNYRVTLSCVHSYVTGSGKNRRRSERVMWQTEGVCFTQRMASGTNLSFRFDVPDDLPESDIKSATKYHLWRVSISCSMPGTDFDRQFEIPVFKGVRHSSELTMATEKYHRTIETAHDGIYQIAQINELPRGLDFYFPPLKRPAGGIIAVIFGLVFGGAGVAMWHTEAPFFFPLIFTPIGILILLVGIWELGKSLRVRIDGDSLQTRRYFMKYPITTKSVPIADIKLIRTKEGSTVSNGRKTTVYYKLIAHTMDGERIVIAERLCSKPEVELIRKAFEQYLPALNTSDKT